MRFSEPPPPSCNLSLSFVSVRTGLEAIMETYAFWRPPVRTLTFEDFTNMQKQQGRWTRAWLASLLFAHLLEENWYFVVVVSSFGFEQMKKTLLATAKYNFMFEFQRALARMSM